MSVWSLDAAAVVTIPREVAPAMVQIGTCVLNRPCASGDFGLGALSGADGVNFLPTCEVGAVMAAEKARTI